ncbi:MAG TPA: 3'-5' exonuclease [Byssovorax sp.]
MSAPRSRSAAPPAGPPWDAPIAEAKLAFVDLEMTGLRADVDRVIEVCVERVEGERVVASLASLVRPDVWAFGNAHIHGIDPREVERAPTFAELAPRVAELLDGAVLVAHAAAWDVAFLEAEFARAGASSRVPFYLDTLTLSRRAFALPSHRLGALAEAFGVEQRAAHRAEDDVRVLREVFRRVSAQLAPTTPRDLWHVRVGNKLARPDIVAAAVRAAEVGAAVDVRFRRARKAPEELALVVKSVRTDVDPPLVLAYDLRTRSRLELRADRILAITARAEAATP